MSPALTAKLVLQPQEEPPGQEKSVFSRFYLSTYGIKALFVPEGLGSCPGPSPAVTGGRGWLGHTLDC